MLLDDEVVPRVRHLMTIGWPEFEPVSKGRELTPENCPLTLTMCHGRLHTHKYTMTFDVLDTRPVLFTLSCFACLLIVGQ